jgi:hypothetical protein
VSRSLAAIIFVVAMASAAQAAECTSSLRDRWSNASAEMENMSADGEKVGNLAEASSDKVKAFCATIKNKMPEVLDAAKQYFPACHPKTAPAQIAMFQRLADQMAQVDKSFCK